MDKLLSLGQNAFTIHVLDDKSLSIDTNSDNVGFTVQLMDKTTDPVVPVVESLCSWDAFADLALFVRSVAPKFDAPPMTSASTATRADRRQYMQRYFTAALATAAICRLREVQDFIGYTEYAHTHDKGRGVQAEEGEFGGKGAFGHAEHPAEARLRLRHVSPPRERGEGRRLALEAKLSAATVHEAPLLRASDVVRREQMALRGGATLSSRDGMTHTVHPSLSHRSLAMEDSNELMSNPSYSPTDLDHLAADGIDEDEMCMLEECFRMMDVGAAGYITPDDMREFFSAAMDAADGGNTYVGVSVTPTMLQRRKMDEPCNLQQFITLVRSALRRGECHCTVNEWVDRYWLMQYRKIFLATGVFVNSGPGLPTEPLNGLDPSELAALLYAITEAGLRLFAWTEVLEWVGAKRHQRSCALTLEQLAALLDTLSKAVPFAETWVALLPRGDGAQRVQPLLCSYAAVADRTIAEEMREHIMQLQRTASFLAGHRCPNCADVMEQLARQSTQLDALEQSRTTLRARVEELEAALLARKEAHTRLEQRQRETAALLEDAERREAELADALETTERRPPADPKPISETHTLHLTPHGHKSALGHVAPRSAAEDVWNGTGPLTYRIPSHMAYPMEWCVELCAHDGADGRHVGAERIVCRDDAGGRSCSFVFAKSELSILAPGGEVQHRWTLLARRWYRLHCTLDWKAHTFRVTLVEGGKKVTATMCGPFAMVDGEPHGVAIVDIFPRSEVLLNYRNFFLSYPV